MPLNVGFCKTYKMHWLVRWAVYAAAGFFGFLFTLPFIVSRDPKYSTSNGVPSTEECLLLIIPVICLLIAAYTFWRRVTLFHDAFEIRGLRGTTRYLRSNIVGVSSGGQIYLKNPEQSIRLPRNVHPDDDYIKWFDSLPKHGDQSAQTATPEWKEDIDLIGTTATELGTTKGKATGFLILSSLVAIVIGGLLCAYFGPVAFFAGLLLFKKVIIPGIILGLLGLHHLCQLLRNKPRK